MKNIVALLTLYYPNLEHAENVRKIAEQVGLVLVIDNTPQVDNAMLFSSIKNAKYIANKENLGLSMAFNRCLQFDECKNSDYIVFFDQDTHIVENQIERLVSDFETLEKNFKVGCVGPLYFEKNMQLSLGKDKDSRSAGNNCFTVHAMITSSMVTKYSILEDAGFWNENYFLDYADLELGWRLEHKGYTNFVSANVQMEHKLGDYNKPLYYPLKHKYLHIVIHSPVRVYYQVREGHKALHCRYLPKTYRPVLIKALIARFVVRVLYIKEKQKTIKYTFLGFIDGIRGVNGCLKAS